MPSLPESLRELLEHVIAPLIEADGGQLRLVSYSPQEMVLHLGGRFAGCPGNDIVRRQIIAPAVKSAAPDLRLVVLAGATVPEGAEVLAPR